jgi:outer membrane protein TolC
MKTHLIIFTLLCAFGITTANAAESWLRSSTSLSREPQAVESTALGSNLPALLDYAREHNPGLAASRFEAEAAAQRLVPAQALPDPVLRIEPMDVTNQSGETRYLLMQNLPWFGKRELQRAGAAAQAAQADGQVIASWSELANRIKTAYATFYFTAESERLARQTLELLEGLEQIVQTRYAHGLASQQDVIRVQVEQTMLQSELIALRNEHHHSQTRLNVLLSRPANSALAEPKQLRAMPPVAELDEAVLQERLRARNPQLRIADADIRAAENQRELSRAKRYPDFTLGIAPTQSGSEIKRWDLMLELNIPLQQASRRAEQGEAAAMLSASNARKQALLEQMFSELSENLSALESTRRTEHLIATRLLPQAELTYRSAMAGYENSKVDFAMLVEAQKQILKVRQQHLQTQTDMQLRLADIEKLLGEE